MFLRPNYRGKDGKDHTHWSLVETVRTVDGPRQRTVCYLGEVNGSVQARWLKSVEVFNEQGEAEQLKLFPSHVEVPDDDPQVARVLVKRVRLERTRQFGACFLGWELSKRLGLESFFAQAMDEESTEVPWSRVAAVLAINRLCAQGSELVVELQIEKNQNHALIPFLPVHWGNSRSRLPDSTVAETRVRPKVVRFAASPPTGFAI